MAQDPEKKRDSEIVLDSPFHEVVGQTLHYLFWRPMDKMFDLQKVLDSLKSRDSTYDQVRILVLLAIQSPFGCDIKVLYSADEQTKKSVNEEISHAVRSLSQRFAKYLVEMELYHRTGVSPHELLMELIKDDLAGLKKMGPQKDMDEFKYFTLTLSDKFRVRKDFKNTIATVSDSIQFELLLKKGEKKTGYKLKFSYLWLFNKIFEWKNKYEDIFSELDKIGDVDKINNLTYFYYKFSKHGKNTFKLKEGDIKLFSQVAHDDLIDFKTRRKQLNAILKVMFIEEYAINRGDANFMNIFTQSVTICTKDRNFGKDGKDDKDDKDDKMCKISENNTNLDLINLFVFSGIDPNSQNKVHLGYKWYEQVYRNRFAMKNLSLGNRLIWYQKLSSQQKLQLFDKVIKSIVQDQHKHEQEYVCNDKGEITISLWDETNGVEWDYLLNICNIFMHALINELQSEEMAKGNDLYFKTQFVISSSLLARCLAYGMAHRWMGSDGKSFARRVVDWKDIRDEINQIIVDFDHYSK